MPSAFACFIPDIKAAKEGMLLFIFKDLVREGDKLMFVCERYFADVYKFTLDFKYANKLSHSLELTSSCPPACKDRWL